MEISKTNKTLILCSIFISGTASVFLNIIPYILTLFCALAVFCIYKKLFSYKFIAACTLVLIFSIFYTHARLPSPDYLCKQAPAKLTVRGKVASIPQSNFQNKIPSPWGVVSRSKQHVRIALYSLSAGQIFLQKRHPG